MIVTDQPPVVMTAARSIPAKSITPGIRCQVAAALLTMKA